LDKNALVSRRDKGYILLSTNTTLQKHIRLFHAFSQKLSKILCNLEQVIPSWAYSCFTASTTLLVWCYNRRSEERLLQIRLRWRLQQQFLQLCQSPEISEMDISTLKKIEVWLWKLFYILSIPFSAIDSSVAIPYRLRFLRQSIFIIKKQHNW